MINSAAKENQTTVGGNTPLSKRLLKNPRIVVSVVILLILTLASVLAPWIAPHNPEQIDLFRRLQEPSKEFFLGTDEVGRDIFSRLLYGGQISLAVGFVSALISVLVGTLLGGIAGQMRGLVDAIIMRITDGMLSIPIFFFLLVIMAIFGTGLTQIVVVIGLTSWMPIARIVRAEVIRVNELPFVEAAHSIGARSGYIMVKHLLPQAVPSVIVAATLGVANAILLEAALSYLSLGIQPPIPSWGNMLQAAQAYVWDSPLIALWPGLMVFFVVMCFNMLGDGLRDALDPKDD